MPEAVGRVLRVSTYLLDTRHVSHTKVERFKHLNTPSDARADTLNYLEIDNQIKFTLFVSLIVVHLSPNSVALFNIDPYI